MYKIVITKMEDNPDYEAQKEAYNKWEEENRAWGGNYGQQRQKPQDPEKVKAIKKLETVVDEEAFAAIRKACVEKL